ncbi:MAG TPA: metallophosphoesterase family protein [Thermodesulfobacteriota bacterium]|nr:metallophosphoesterase family protein [Thermodesulfobacteriota bacterium]
MRYAVISDIHSNLEALNAILSKISELNADDILCLGDVVGYGANPNECIDIVRRTGIRCIMGNHDSRASGLEEPDNFTPLAKEAALWTRDQLTGDNKRFLRELPRELTIEGFIIFHGSIRDTDRYIIDERDASDNFQLLENLPDDIRLGFYGHTHVRVALSLQRGKVFLEPDEELRLAPWKRYLINPGSVGQPRDRDPSASFLIYDEFNEKVNFYRVDYDIAATQKKIIEAGLPVELAQRLAVGR